jgi:uncharacterized protein
MTWQIHYETKPKLKDPIFVEGLPGIGNVGKIAVDFLIEDMGAKKLCSFFSHKFPRSVFINDENLVEMPKVELYYKRFKDKRDILLLTGDIQPIDEESCFTFCEEILKIAKHYDCREIITTGGIGLQQIPEKPKVYVTSNDANLLKRYLKNQYLEKSIFGVVGPIVGVSGVLLGLGKVKGVSLLAETFAHPMYLGIKGAKELLRVFEKQFSYGIDIKKMSKEIIEVEKELMAKTKEFASEAIQVAQAGAKGKSKEVHYIG